MSPRSCFSTFATLSGVLMTSRLSVWADIPALGGAGRCVGEVREQARG
jgi:hypothetical protein